MQMHNLRRFLGIEGIDKINSEIARELSSGNEGCAFVCEEFEPEEEEIHKTRWGEVREGEEEEEELKDVSEESSELSDAAEGEEATENVEVEDEVSSDEEREQGMPLIYLLTIPMRG